MKIDAQIRQILDWSGEPQRAYEDFLLFSQKYIDFAGKDFDLEPVNAKRLLSIFGNSHFLSQFLIRYPLEADSLVASPCIETDKKLSDFEEDLLLAPERLESFSDEEFASHLCRYKYREFLRLTVKDLSQAAGQETVLSEISNLAIALVRAALAYEKMKMRSTWGEAFLSNPGEFCGFCVIGMGKLSGNELNYSSDIDLQYIYSTDEGRVHGPRDVSLHEYFIKLSEKLTRLLSQNRPEGFLYRVDLNLRPEGRSGTLANSLNAIENYYESFGEEWERQALIRSAPIAGDLELGEEFEKILEPFVWRKHLDLGAINRMKEMKRKAHESIKSSSLKGFNVKLGEGGIRDIEFFVQALQMLYGGSKPQLRSPSTLKALQELTKQEIVPAQEAHQLKDAYLFLRRLEHRLQLVQESQTQTLPYTPVDQQAVARRMGYYEEDPEEARERLLDDLTRFTTIAKNTFDRLFE